MEGHHGGFHEQAAEEQGRRDPDFGRRGRKSRRRFLERDAAGSEQEERDRREHEHAGHRGKQEVLPGSLECCPLVPDRHQDECGDGRDFDEDVQGKEIPDHGDAIDADQGDEHEVRKCEPRPRPSHARPGDDDRRQAGDARGEQEEHGQVVGPDGEADSLLQGSQKAPVDQAEGLENREGGLQAKDGGRDDPCMGARAARQDVENKDGGEWQQEKKVAHRLPPNRNAAVMTTAAAPTMDQRM